MTREDWDDGANRCFGFQLGRVDAAEEAILVLMNAGADALSFGLPAAPGAPWRLLFGTEAGAFDGDAASVRLPAETVWILASAPAGRNGGDHG
jgi:pullulanase/glycogen debranching enzyme